MKKINIIGAQCGLGAQDIGTGRGPGHLLEMARSILKQNPSWVWENLPLAPAGPDKEQRLIEYCSLLGQKVAHVLSKKEDFVVLGGDHAMAIGTWSGVASSYREQGPIGLLWLDAHLDAHTPETSPSQNIHGMPVACLLGHGHAALTELMDGERKLKPEHICIIGARSYEAGELALLEREGVRIYFMEEVKERGLSEVYQEARTIVQKGTVGFGVSLDLDAIDPTDAPAVGTPVEDGIAVQAILSMLADVATQPKFLGLEITEYNPEHDKEQQAAQYVLDMIRTVYEGK